MPEERDMRRMQQEAVRRVNEMQSRARRLQERPPDPPEEGREEPPPVVGEEMARPKEPAAVMPSAGTLFDGLMQDKERTLILLLILLLFTENADTSVIFSLLYLIL